ncbi:hypothetical protein K1719_017704 [Acacia pycnantha]|nr:hypothetical protein K1719_017704 [Acacia pycnantha]
MKNRRHHQKREKGIKVTYISSPMKVKTSASNFRALVQKLTGKYSNVAEAGFMEEDRDENDDYELIMKGSSSSSSSLELDDEQQWRMVVGPDEPNEEQEAVPANWLVDPVFNEQLVLEFLGIDAL